MISTLLSRPGFGRISWIAALLALPVELESAQADPAG
jgi:hypothetical protein